jgi:hypothetical protein
VPLGVEPKELATFHHFRWFCFGNSQPIPLIVNTQTETSATVIDFPKAWQRATVSRCGISVELHLCASPAVTRKALHRFDLFLERETSLDTEAMLRLAIAADLLVDDLVAGGSCEVAVAIGTSIEPPEHRWDDTFFAPKLSGDAVVALAKGGQRIAIASMVHLIEGQEPSLYSVSADRASACVVLAQRALVHPADFDDLLRSFHAQGCVLSDGDVLVGP